MRNTGAFDLDEKLTRTVEALRLDYGLRTKADVLQKAVALLKVAAAHELSRWAICIVKPDGEPLKVQIQQLPRLKLVDSGATCERQP